MLRKTVFRVLIALAAANCLHPAAAAVKFTGLGEDLEKNARALMELANTPCESPEWRVQRIFDSSEEKLREALEAMGLYRYSVTRTLSFEDGDCWQAGFTVVAGERTTIRDVDIVVSGEALDDPNFGTNTEGLRPLPGSVLNHGHYERYKKQLLARLRARGYFDAVMTESAVTIDESLAFADIRIRLDSGPRYFFGDVIFTEGILSPSLLGAYARFKKGDPYDAEKIAKLHETLSGSGYFSSVSIRAEPTASSGREVPVTVLLTPGKRRIYTIGAGFGTDTGVQGRLGYSNRRRNDRGHQLDTRLFLSSVESELTGTYRWPRGRPGAEWVELYGGFLQKRTDTSRSDKSTLGVRVTRNRGEKWLETPYLDVTYEDFLVGEQAGTSRLIIPGIRWESTVGRELGRFRQGHSLKLDLRGAHQGIGSDTSFGQATAAGKWIRSYGERTRLIGRVNLGGTIKNDLDDLPATVRFFTGGDSSVRGYGFETIGPLDDEGNVVGGANMLALSIEADWLVKGNWGFAAFVDSGSAFNDTDIEMKTGIGIGLRWFSPLGPIRFDIAHPLDDPERDFRLHISLGPDL